MEQLKIKGLKINEKKIFNVDIDKTSGGNSIKLTVLVVKGQNKGSTGPILTVSGGVHGDEYEGPISLMNIARSVEANSINGQIIIIPSLNFPAFMVGDRVSPIDGLTIPVVRCIY